MNDQSKEATRMEKELNKIPREERGAAFHYIMGYQNYNPAFLDCLTNTLISYRKTILEYNREEDLNQEYLNTHKEVTQ